MFFFRTIRFKIILLYILMSAATLSLFSVLLYRNFSHSLYKNIDDLLKLKAAGIVTSIEAYREAHHSEVTRTQGKSNISRASGAELANLVDRWIKDKSSDPDLINFVVHVFDAQGKPIASSKDLPDSTTMRPVIFEYVLKGTPRFDNFDVLSSEGDKLSLRAVTSPVIERRRVAYIVQVASSLTAIQKELNNLKAILILLVPLTSLLTGLAGSFLVKMTLRPVDDMVRSIREIKADNLKMRLKVPLTNDEIRRLSETYNEMLERLERAFTSQQRFNQDISHELKTPLTILKGELEVTLKKSRTPEEYEGILFSALEEIDKIRRILDNLLLLARYDSKEMASAAQPVDLNLLMEKVAAHMKILADQKQIQINYLQNGTTVINGHENQLRRLFINLIDNAIKYTPQRGRVALTLSRDNDLAVVEVSDSGIGIPDNELPYIFERFYRVDKARSSEGFGLGLSIAKSIAQAHQGDIKVRSHTGLGTTFTVFLPATSP